MGFKQSGFVPSVVAHFRTPVVFQYKEAAANRAGGRFGRKFWIASGVNFGSLGA